MRKRFFPWLVVLNASLCSGNSNPNLLVNGDFDSGFTGWVGSYGIWDVYPGHTINPGPLSGTRIGIVVADQAAMRQTFVTQPGQMYQLSFYGRIPDLDANGIPITGESRSGPSDLKVSWNYLNLQHILLQNRTTWNFYTLNFTADSFSSELELSVDRFTSQTFQYSADTFLDNVSLVAIPEPPSATLSAAAIALLSVCRLARLRKNP